MWKLMAALSIAVLSGCVSTGEYQNLEAKYEHQLEVKELMETEHDELSHRMDTVDQVYRHVAQEQIGVKAQANKIQGDLRAVQEQVRDTQNLYESQKAQFAQQGQQLSTVDAHLQTIGGKIETLTETTAALANRFERVETLIGKIGKSVQARGSSPEPTKPRVQSAERKAEPSKKADVVAKADTPTAEPGTSPVSGGSVADPSIPSQLPAERAVGTPSLPAKPDVPMIAPPTVIEARNEPQQAKDWKWLKGLLGGFLGGKDVAANPPMPAPAVNPSPKRPFLPPTDGEALAAPVDTMGINSESQGKSNLSASDAEKR